MFVTADDIHWNDSYDFVEEQRKAFERRRQHDRRLIRKAAELGIEPEQLDEAVHEAASSAASSINNGGVDDQIVYLVEHWALKRPRRSSTNCRARRKSMTMNDNRHDYALRIDGPLLANQRRLLLKSSIPCFAATLYVAETSA